MLYTVLVNWNSWQDTIACCESLRASDHPAVTVVICDNASDDASLVELTRWADCALSRDNDPPLRPKLPRVCSRLEWMDPAHPQLRFILLANTDNYGFAGGNNVGIALALSDPECGYVFLLNNDTEVAPDALTQLEARAGSDPTLAVVGATLVFHERPDTLQGLGCCYDRYRGAARTLFIGQPASALPSIAQIEREIDYAIGAAMFIRADVLRRTGGLSEAYFLYYEEMDLSQQLQPGERVGWAPGAVIRHKVGGSIGTGRAKARPSNVSLYYDQRSRLQFYRTYWPAFLPFWGLAVCKQLLAYGRKGDLIAVRLILKAIGDGLTRPAGSPTDLSRFQAKR